MNIYLIRNKWSKQERGWEQIYYQYTDTHFNAYNVSQKISSLARDVHATSIALRDYIDPEEEISADVRRLYNLEDRPLTPTVTRALNAGIAKDTGKVMWPVNHVQAKLANMRDDYMTVQQQVNMPEHERDWQVIVDTTSRILNDVRWVTNELAKIPTKKEALELAKMKLDDE